MPYFSFQGKIYLAEKNADGSPKALRFVGNAPEASFGFEISTLEHKDSTTGTRATDLQLETEKKGRVRLTLEDLSLENLAFAFRGTKTSMTGASVTNEVLTPTSGAAVGDVYRTKFGKISAVTITDSAGSPATLALTTNYTLEDADYGLIKLVNITGFTLPLKINYTYATLTGATFLSAAKTPLYLYAALKNTANSDAKGVVELYKVELQPAAEFAIINDQLGQLQLEGVALIDTNFQADPNFGQFGRYISIP